MKHLRNQFLIAAVGAIALFFTSLSAQDEQLAFVRDWVGYRVVGEFAPNPNIIDVYHDYCLDYKIDIDDLGDPCENRSPYGLDYDDFIQMLTAAYAEGRGGVIDFETPILGPAYSNVERRQHRAHIEQFQLDNPVEAFEAQVRADNPGIGDADALALATWVQQQEAYAAAEAALLDESDVIPVVARQDRSLTDTVDRPIIETLVANDIIGFYGLNQDIPLVISRGERSYTEGQVATYNYPAPWDLNAMVNGEFFPTLGISSYSGEGGSAYRPMSGINTFNSGMHDMRFDPRDNVKVVGFVHPNYGNYQYYQGPSGIPKQPNNIRVVVEFSNGESEEFAETSGQDTGLWDTFYAFQAPEGASITRVWIRVKGDNWRTFVALDDVAFITEPALSYVASGKSFSGSVNAEFYELVQIGQNPDSISVEGLPAGLSYDPDSGLISGTFTESGTITATVTMTNSVGESQEELTFEIAPAGDPQSYLQLDSVNPVNVVLRRNLPTVILLSNLDEELPTGTIEYFASVEKIEEDGSRSPSSLDFLGLTLRDNTLFGKPGAAQQIGNYEVTVYGRIPSSASQVTFHLSILAPTRNPNFDANGTTDFAVVFGGNLLTALNPESGETFDTNILTSAISGIPVSAEVYTGDFNGDIRTDLLFWDSGTGSVGLYLANEDGSFSKTTLLDGIDPSSGEDIVGVADYDGDGSSDVYWTNSARNRISVWLIRGGKIGWAGLLEKSEGLGQRVQSADYSGGGSAIELLSMSENLYRLETYTAFTSLGKVEYEQLDFTQDPSLKAIVSADFSNDGQADILWENPDTGAVSLWRMNGLSANTHYFLPQEEETDEPAEAEPETGLDGLPLLPAGFDWSIVTAVDLNNDQYADLVLRNRSSGSLGVLFLRENQALGTIVPVAGDSYDLIATGDYNGDSINELLIMETSDRQLYIAPVTVSGAGQRVAYMINPADAVWFTEGVIRNQANDISIDFDWLGTYTFVDNRWLYSDKWGYMAPVSTDPETGALWFWDVTLGYIWTSPEYFPNVFQERNGFWLMHVEGSQDPKWFYNYIFGFYMTENEL